MPLLPAMEPTGLELPKAKGSLSNPAPETYWGMEVGGWTLLLDGEEQPWHGPVVFRLRESIPAHANIKQVTFTLPLSSPSSYIWEN